jgi:hypothetical protein
VCERISMATARIRTSLPRARPSPRSAGATDPQDEERFREALAAFADPGAIEATLASVDDGTIRDQDLSDIYRIGLRNVAARDRYWRHFQQRYATRIAPLEAMVRNGLLTTLGQLTPPELAADADAFLARIDAGDSAEVVMRTRDALRLLSRAAQRVGREMEVALRR